ncbi:MAG: magnesium transporter [Candidatus Sumerlaeia bacterium]|nr:magnesium transporter [Candidatus Sumerlaeia bacterium]
MLGNALIPEIQELIAQRDFSTLKSALADIPAADVAEILTDIPVADSAVVFRILPRDLAAEIFEYLEFDTQEALVSAMNREEVAAIIEQMEPDDRTALLEELPPAVTERILNMMSPEERRIAQTLLNYPEYSVGRLMTTEYVRLKPEWTVAQALDHLRQFGRDKETLHHLYVTDKKGKLLDELRLRELVLAKPEQRVEDLLDLQVQTLNAYDDQEEAVRGFERYDRGAMPVVNKDGVLVGLVTADDVLDVAQEEATEDIQRAGAVEALETPYDAASVGELLRKRSPWLIVLFAGETLTAHVMKGYEGLLASAVVLALFVPLIISSGGNSGSQASTLVIRALALGEVAPGDWWRLLRREFWTSLSLGGILGVAGFLKVWATGMVSPGIYGGDLVPVAATIALALVGVVMWGSLVGSMFPLLLRRLGRDPAVASAPFVATMVDVTGLAIYFTIAGCVLGITAG